jgi:anti-sigma regulatory factor (Ser/Thr protein kinase)
LQKFQTSSFIRTMANRPKTLLIRQFLSNEVCNHPQDIAKVAATRFHISRQAINRHLKAMEKAGTLINEGKTKARNYKLCPLADITLTLNTAGLEEHVPWQNEIRPRLVDVPKNIIDVCNYGFTEMLNNAIDHSGSETVVVQCRYTSDCIDIKIADQGIGIFKKIKNDLKLNDELEAIKQLAKGKLTTDPARHTGEGIFFTSRIFDRFIILSGDLYFSHLRPNNDWLIENRDETSVGTYINMLISPQSNIDLRDVFDTFTVDKQSLGFSRTHIPINLIQYGTDNLISRSQARRLLSRFDMFKEVILDFSGIPVIGQAFADEIFRVFKNDHPEVDIISINENPFVRSMISRAIEKQQTSKI